MIKALVFDFGGVLAEEGFREGLKAIGIKNGLNPEDFFRTCEDLIYESGYVIGSIDENTYWDKVREKTGITGDNESLRKEILERFTLREEMFDLVKRLRSSGLIVAILSDQTNWLEEINEKTLFFKNFDYIFNSFKIKKSKRDPSIFRYICSEMGLKTDEVLFIDDNESNVKRALKEGLKAILFTSANNLKEEIKSYLSKIKL